MKMRDQQKHDMVTPQINIVFEEVLLCPMWLLWKSKLAGDVWKGSKTEKPAGEGVARGHE